MLQPLPFTKLGAAALLMLSLTGCQDLLDQVLPKPTPPPTAPEGKPAIREQWVARYNSTGNEKNQAQDMAVDATGNVYVTGHETGVDGLSAVTLTIKYSPSGQQLWAARSAGYTAASLTLDPAGNVIITGGAFLTTKYSPSGQQLWQTRYPGFESSEFSGYSVDVAVDRFGNIAVTGPIYTDSSVENDMYLTIKYSPSGQQLWEARYDGVGGAEAPIAVAMDAAGNVVVTGSGAVNRFFAVQFGTVKYAAATGQQLWTARYSADTYEGNLTARALAVDASGTIAVTGTRLEYVNEQGVFEDIVTVKYSSSGQQLWDARYNGAVQAAGRSDYPTDVALDAGGNVIITGTTGVVKTSTGTTGGDYVTIKYSTTGQEMWTAYYDGPGNGQDVANALQIDAVGNVVVTGNSAGQGTDTDYATLKYSASGKQVWATRYDGPARGMDAPVALAIDATGDILVAGSSAGTGTGSDLTTIKYRELR